MNSDVNKQCNPGQEMRRLKVGQQHGVPGRPLRYKSNKRWALIRGGGFASALFPIRVSQSEAEERGSKL